MTRALTAFALALALALVAGPAAGQSYRQEITDSTGVDNETPTATAHTRGMTIRGTAPGGTREMVQTDAAGNLSVVAPAGAPLAVDLAEVAGTATNVNGGNRDAGTQTVTLADDDPAVTDLAALLVDSNAMVVDLAALEILSTAANVDLAAIEALLITVDADTGAILLDTNAMVVDLAALEVLDTTRNATLATLATEATAAAIQTAVELIDDTIAGSEQQVDVVAALPTGANVIGAVGIPPAALATIGRTNVACDDTGAVAFTSNAADKVVWVSNGDTQDDVCISMGTAGTPDRTNPDTCDLLIGPWSGSGTKLVTALPEGFGADFECDCNPTVDGDGDCDLNVTAFR